MLGGPTFLVLDLSVFFSGRSGIELEEQYFEDPVALRITSFTKQRLWRSVTFRASVLSYIARKYLNKRTSLSSRITLCYNNPTLF